MNFCAVHIIMVIPIRYMQYCKSSLTGNPGERKVCSVTFGPIRRLVIPQQNPKTGNIHAVSW